MKTKTLRSNSKSLGNHVVSTDEEKERLQWEGFAEKGGVKSGMKERVGDGKLITNTRSSVTRASVTTVTIIVIIITTTMFMVLSS